MIVLFKKKQNIFTKTKKTHREEEKNQSVYDIKQKCYYRKCRLSKCSHKDKCAEGISEKHGSYLDGGEQNHSWKF